MNSQNKPLEGLEKKLNRLISESAGITEDKITNNWIMAQREKYVYPDSKPTLESQNGGHVNRHFRYLTIRAMVDIMSLAKTKAKIFQRSEIV